MTRKQLKYRGPLRVLVAISLLLALVATAGAASFVVIANRDVPASSLSKSELQAIFLGEKVKWDNRHYIKIVVPENETVSREFYQLILGKTLSQFDNHWAKLAYSGRAVMPQSIAEMSKLVDYVANQKGAISFVPSGQAVGSVKVITVK